MQRVLDILAQHQADGKALRLFVSQSPRSLARESFAEWLLQSIASAGIEGTSLIIDLRRNGGGDPYFTDGKVKVAVLAPHE